MGRTDDHECMFRRGEARDRDRSCPSSRLRHSLWAAADEPRIPSRLTRDFANVADEELVLRSRDGCSQATEILLGKYRGLVEGKARTFFLAGAERDDVIQEGMIGLYKAIRDFLPEKKVAFRSFAETCVTRQIITATKMATRKKHRLLNSSISLDTPPDASGGTDALEAPTPAMLSASSPEQILLGKDTAREIGTRMRTSLSELECIALTAYLRGRSYHEIAHTMQMTPKQIDNALQRAKRKMKGRLARTLRECD